MTPFNFTTKEMKKLYSAWSVRASKMIKEYVETVDWYNIKWKNKSKEIPFYINLKKPKSFKGRIYFSARPVNYAFAKGVSKFNNNYKRFPRGINVKPVHKNNAWFIPKKYKADIKNINTSIISPINGGTPRFFSSKTSHNKTRKYKKPLLWYNIKGTKIVEPVTLKDNPADVLYHDEKMWDFIQTAFEDVIEEKLK